MAKATLLQTLLGRPSQKYVLPPTKDYYSSKDTMRRLAAEAQREVESNDDDELCGSPHPEERAEPVHDHNEQDDSDDDQFYTPRSSFVDTDTSSEPRSSLEAAASDMAASDISTSTPPTSEATHMLYTDQDWGKDVKWLVHPPLKATPIVIKKSKQRSPASSIMMSMSTLMEEDEDPHQKPWSPKSSTTNTPAHRHARSVGTSASSYKYYSPTPPDPGPPALPSYGTPGYTSLTLPPLPSLSTPTLARSNSLTQRLRASLRRERVDLARTGLAQTTMASVEVVGGLAAGSAPSRSPYGQAPRLGFTHYRAPPHAVPKGGVLVQVWAVGLDSTDLRLLGGTGRAADRTRSRTQSLGRLLGRRVASESSAAADTNNTTDESGAPAQVGFIPGRSFVGRVLECGWEVNDDVVKRGEWVVGLLDVRKSGALAEFITVDRHRIQRVPHPRMNASSGSEQLQRAPLPQDGTHPDAPPPHLGLALSRHNQDTPYPNSRPVSFAASASSLGHAPAVPSRRSSVVESRQSPLGPSRQNSTSSSHSRPPSRQNSLSSHPPSARTKSRPASISTGRPTSSASSASPRTPRRPPLTLPELALLPLCGVAAHRAVRTFAFVGAGGGAKNNNTHNSYNKHNNYYDNSIGRQRAELGTVLEETPRLVRGASAGSMDTMRGAAAVSNGKSGDSHAPDGGGRRRVLVLGGHSGIGGLAARMLVRLGWRVCVHAPAMWFEGKESDGEDDEGMHHEEKGEGQEGRERRYMHGVQERVRAWGVEEVVFDDGEGYVAGNGEAADGGRGATVRAVERLIEDKDVFDAVLDTVGGKEVWEAGEKLLRNGDKGAGGNGGGPKQFTTTVGDWPARPVPTAGDNFKAGLRAMRGNNNATQDEEGGKKAKKAKTKAGKKGGEGASSKSKVRYAWVSCAQDVDWEGEDVRDTLAAVLRLAVEDGVRPHAGAREVPFERAERTFGGGGTLARGESVVVRVAG